MVRQTSIEVFREITDSGLLSKKRLEVYGVIYDKGPITGAQANKEMRRRGFVSTVSETVRNRITELVDCGVVYPAGVTTCPVTGRQVMLWDVTNKLPEKPKIKLSNKKKLQRYTRACQVLAKSASQDHLQEARAIVRGDP